MLLAAVPIFPPTVRPGRRIDPGLLQALALAQGCCDRVQAQRTARAAALAELGDIELPDAEPTAEDPERMQLVGPLYLAHELEQAGLLRTAELIAGLFAAGAINQPLGPTGALIAAFWQTRRQRLAAAEREQLLAQVFDAHDFYPQMQRLCDSLAEQLDSPPRPGDLHARVELQEAARALAESIAPRTVGMVAVAAPELVQTISQATHFLRDRLLQTAFGVHDLWGLLDTVGRSQGAPSGVARRHVELGRQGAAVLGWLADGSALDPGSARGQQVVAAAEAWRTAWAAMPRGGAMAGSTTTVPAA